MSILGGLRGAPRARWRASYLDVTAVARRVAMMCARTRAAREGQVAGCQPPCDAELVGPPQLTAVRESALVQHDRIGARRTLDQALRLGAGISDVNRVRAGGCGVAAPRRDRELPAWRPISGCGHSMVTVSRSSFAGATT